MATKSFGQNGNRYIQRGFAQESGPNGFDHGKYSGHIHAYPQNGGQGYNLGWNGYQGGNTFNPYRKVGYGHQNQDFNNGLGLGNGRQLFGVPQPVNFVGNQRINM